MRLASPARGNCGFALPVADEAKPEFPQRSKNASKRMCAAFWAPQGGGVSGVSCLPLRGPWVCPSVHTGAVGVPLTEGLSTRIPRPRRGDPCGRPPSCAHIRQTAEQCSALRCRRTSLRRGRRPRRPAVPRSPVIANQCALPPLQGEVSPALAPVTEGSPRPRRGGYQPPAVPRPP